MSELLAKMTSHGNWPDGTPWGGRAEVTPEMVAAACAGMSRYVYLYGLAKFTLDAEALKSGELQKLNLEAVEYQARVKRWQADEYKLAVFANLVLKEALEPRKCKRCRGSRLQQNQKPCPACSGKGFLGASGEKCAEGMCITPVAWSKTWRRRFDDVLSDFAVFDDIIAKRLRRRLG